MLLINNVSFGMGPKWADYCLKNGIPYRPIDVYKKDFWSSCKPGDVVFWHIRPGDPNWQRIVDGLETAGVHCFPNKPTRFGFNDKAAQAIVASLWPQWFPENHIIFRLRDGINFLRTANYPIVWKHPAGSGSANVRLIHSQLSGLAVVFRAFTLGLPAYRALPTMLERLRQLFLKNTDLRLRVRNLLSALLRIFVRPSKRQGFASEKVVLFQEFLPGNNFDTRVMVVGGKAVAMRRYARGGDFRVSGSGFHDHDQREIDPRAIAVSFEVADFLKSDALALDFLTDKSGELKICEFGFGWTGKNIEKISGHWDRQQGFLEIPIDLYGEMVEIELARERGRRPSNSLSVSDNEPPNNFLEWLN